MRCRNCQSELNNSEAISRCPQCGALLFQWPSSEPHTFGEVVKAIVLGYDNCTDVLYDGERTLAIFIDLAPKLQKARENYGYLVKSGANRLLLDALSQPKAKQLSARKAAAQAIMGVSQQTEKAALEICDSFWGAIGGPKLVAPPTVAPPKSTASAPESVSKTSEPQSVSLRNSSAKPVHSQTVPQKQAPVKTNAPASSDGLKRVVTWLLILVVAVGLWFFFQPSDNAMEYLPSDSQTHYLLPYSNSRYLTEADIEDFSREELVLVRNEIFARHGRMFNNAEIQQYFNNQPWYSPEIDPNTFDKNVESIFNEYELANVKFIMEYEKDKGWCN